MTRFLTTAILTLLAVTTGVTLTEGADPSPAAVVVSTFYRQHLSEMHTGLLNAGELAQIRPFLSSGLYEQYLRAVRAREVWGRAFPDDPSRRIFNKPPCVEGGDYFNSLAEWPDVHVAEPEGPGEHFQVGRAMRRKRGLWHVPVRFWYDTVPKVEWVDTVVVVSENHDRLAIDDVLYAGGTFNRSGRLSELLDGCIAASRVDTNRP